MYTEGFEQWFKMSKNLTTPVSEFNKAATEICQRTAQQNLEMIGENFTRLSDQLKRLSNIRKPEDVINLQKDVINENITATIENVQKIIHLTMENMEALAKIFGASLHDTVTTVTKHADKEKEKSGRS